MDATSLAGLSVSIQEADQKGASDSRLFERTFSECAESITNQLSDVTAHSKVVYDVLRDVIYLPECGE